jgi:transcriptional regulator with XRE-family HTH domain
MMPHSEELDRLTNSNSARAPLEPMTDDRRLEVVAQFTDDILAKLTDAFFEVVKEEGWGKRDLSKICGINESAIGHILAGRRKNLTAETIALVARAMKKRPSLTLTDTRPTGDTSDTKLAAEESTQQDQPKQSQSAALAPTEEWVQRLNRGGRLSQGATWSTFDETEFADQRPPSVLVAG